MHQRMPPGNLASGSLVDKTSRAEIRPVAQSASAHIGSKNSGSGEITMVRDDITFRFCDDRVEVNDFYSRMFPDKPDMITFAEWRSRHAEHSGGDSPFVARLGGEIVAAIRMIPLQLRVGTQLVRAAWQMDSVVAASVRGQGIGRELITRSGEPYEVVFAKGTNDTMKRVRVKAGFRDVPNSNYLICVLSGVKFPGGISKKVAAVALNAWSSCRGLIHRRIRLSVLPITAFGEEFDRLAELPLRPGHVGQVKGSGYLNWRYRNCPHREYLVLQASSTDAVRGAVVLRAHATECWIVDLICASSDIECIDALVRAAVSKGRDLGASSLRVFATSEPARRSLRQAGFVGLTSSPRFTYRPRIQQSDVDVLLAKATDWNFWHGDADNELYA